MNIRHSANNAGCRFQHHKFIIPGMRDQHSSAARPRCLESQGPGRIVAEIPCIPEPMAGEPANAIWVWKDCSAAHHVSPPAPKLRMLEAIPMPDSATVACGSRVAPQEMPEDAENLDSLSCNRVWAPKNASTSYNML